MKYFEFAGDKRTETISTSSSKQKTEEKVCGNERGKMNLVGFIHMEPKII